MRKKWVILVIVLGLCLGDTVVMDRNVQTQEKAEQSGVPTDVGKLQAKIEELIKQLGDDDWRTREKAQEELIKIGKPIIHPLIDTIDSTKDPEVKNRSMTILSQLEVEITDEEIALLEKRVEKSKDVNKDILWQALGKWLGTPINGLQLTIKSDKKVYSFRPGEKITIEVRFRNVGKENIYICKHFKWAPYSYEITGPEGSVKIETVNSDMEAPPPLTKDDFILLNAGESHVIKTFGDFQERSNEIVLYAADSPSRTTIWYLCKTGKYQIKMKYQNAHEGKKFGLRTWIGQVISNTIIFEIQESIFDIKEFMNKNWARVDPKIKSSDEAVAWVKNQKCTCGGIFDIILAPTVIRSKNSEKYYKIIAQCEKCDNEIHFFLCEQSGKE